MKDIQEFNALMDLYISNSTELDIYKTKCSFLQNMVDILTIENKRLAEQWLNEMNINLDRQMEDFKKDYKS